MLEGSGLALLSLRPSPQNKEYAGQAYKKVVRYEEIEMEIEIEISN